MVPEGRMVFADQTVRYNLVLGAYTRIAKDPRGVEEDVERTLDMFPRLRERARFLAASSRCSPSRAAFSRVRGCS